MVRRSYNMPEEDPEQKKFERPSESEHLLQVVDVFDQDTAPGAMVLDQDTVCAKIEVAIGPEEGRSLLHRLTLDDQSKFFFLTRFFLKAIGEPCRGVGIEIDTDRWIGRQFYATVKHNGDYANIDQYEFDKCEKLEQFGQGINPDKVIKPEDIAWED